MKITKNDSAAENSTDKLKNFPVSFFSIVMGLSGITIALEKAQQVLAIHLYIDIILAWFTLGIFCLFIFIYFKKIIQHRQSVIDELHHPIKLSFFPAISISLLLISIIFINRIPQFSHILWLLGTSLHLLLTLYVINSWMHHEYFKIQHINPAWFIPAVGNVLVPIAGVAHGYMEISWFFFSIGMMFWIILFTIFFNRVLFHDPLPARLVPTFFILIAPPAVGFIAYMKLTGNTLDSFAHILYYIGLFLSLLLFSQIKMFSRLQFFLSWWAYSFPIAAISLASFLMYETTGLIQFLLIASLLLIILCATIILLLIKTYQAIKMGKICIED